MPNQKQKFLLQRTTKDKKLVKYLAEHGYEPTKIKYVNGQEVYSFPATDTAILLMSYRILKNNKTEVESV